MRLRHNSSSLRDPTTRVEVDCDTTVTLAPNRQLISRSVNAVKITFKNDRPRFFSFVTLINPKSYNLSKKYCLNWYCNNAMVSFREPRRLRSSIS